MAYNCKIDFSKSFLVVTFLVLFTVAMLSVYHAVEKYFLKQTTTTYSKISPKVSCFEVKILFLYPKKILTGWKNCFSIFDNMPSQWFQTFKYGRRAND